jgi:hypothetical protein
MENAFRGLIPEPVTKPPKGKKYVWISGERSRVVWAETLPCPPIWTRMIHPTDVEVLNELEDADVAVFWGHGAEKGGAYLYDPSYTGKPIETAFFTKDDIDALIEKRKGRKMDLLVLMTCESLSDCGTIESYHRLAKVTIGYKYSTARIIPSVSLPYYPMYQPSPVVPTMGGMPHVIGGRTVYD